MEDITKVIKSVSAYCANISKERLERISYDTEKIKKEMKSSNWYVNNIKENLRTIYSYFESIQDNIDTINNEKPSK